MTTDFNAHDLMAKHKLQTQKHLGLYALKILFYLVSLFCIYSEASAVEKLNVALNPVDGVQRTAVYKQIQKFEQANPQIKVSIRVTEHETYKTAIENILSSKDDKIDMFFWFGGSKLRSFADNGWLRPVSEMWRNQNWNGTFSAASRLSVTRNGEQYGLPLYYYQWGIYYRKSIFKKLGIEIPQNWQELLAAGQAIKKANVIPFTLGSKNDWPAAAWFDYLNLRINGLEFHQELLSGCQSFSGQRVTAVLAHWKKLIKQGFFIENHNELNWKDALAYLYQGHAAMMLMGNFFTANIPSSRKDDIGFFPFPKIAEDMDSFEDAPIDVLAISAFAKNKRPAMKLMQFLAQATAQSELAAELSMIPPRIDATLSNDKYIQAGNALLTNASGLAQFYDRATSPEFSSASMPLFIKFMNSPDGIEEIQEELTRAQDGAYRGQDLFCPNKFQHPY